MYKAKIKLAQAPRFEQLYKYDSIVIPIEHGQVRQALEFMTNTGGMSLAKEYELELKETRQKRSIDANNYFWTLCDQLAAKLKMSDVEVYRQIIRDYGVRTIVPIEKKVVDRWIEVWERKGKGWVCESLGRSKIDGYENVVCYYGSSVYNTKEMSRIIDAIVEECKAQDIETKTPAEIEELKQNWNVI